MFAVAFAAVRERWFGRGDWSRMATAENLLSLVRERLTPLYGSRLKGVVLYGSVARGEEGPDSDIDLLVLLDSVAGYGREVRQCLSALFDLSQELGRRISPKPVVYDDYRRGTCPLYRTARREGVVA